MIVMLVSERPRIDVDDFAYLDTVLFEKAPDQGWIQERSVKYLRKWSSNSTMTRDPMYCGSQ